jgi:hypothetical protein
MKRINFKDIGVKIMVIIFGTLFSVTVIQAAFLTDSSGDNLGNHIVTENLKLNNFWLSGDGGNEGVFVTSAGNVGVGVSAPAQKFQVNGYVRGDTGFCIGTSCITSWPSGGTSIWSQNGTNAYYNTGNVGIGTSTPSQALQVAGSVAATSFIGALSGNANTATSLAANGANCSSGYYPLGVNASGAAESCIQDSDIYWTGTATNLNAATGRTSLGLGSLATLSSVTGSYITDGTITDIDISSSANISSSKIANGGYMITSAGTSGQVWTSDGVGAGYWGTAGSGSDIYWTGTATNLDPVAGRTSLGLGSLATLSSVTGAYISNGTITNADISSSAGIYASKIQYGTYFITSAGTAGQVWTSDGSGAGTWTSAGSDIYWTGTATNLDAATGRTSLGLGSLATLSSVTGAYISNGTITDIDISSSAAISSSKIANGAYMITSAGTNGQVWTSDGAGAGYWATGGSVSGSGTANYVSKWTGTSSQGNSIIYDNGTNVGIGTASPSYKLHVNGTAFSSGWYTTSDSRYKINVSELGKVLPRVLKLRAVSFDWDKVSYPDKNFPEEREYGFIAQEVEKEFPDLVRTDSEGYKSVMYDRFSALLLEAIKEQQQEIEVLTDKVNSLELKLAN